MDFYASIILWLAHMGQIKKTVAKVNRTVGVTVRARTSKNKIGQPFRECEFSILFGYGVDDISSGLEFLKEAGATDKLDLSDQQFKKAFAAAEPKEKARMRKQLNKAVREAWFEIEHRFTPVESKYGAV